ncbi:MAG: hypothetical protein KIG65_02145 [Eubacteriales bacterium]|nr:hypothetical protein [Eubacteriales bacterium]
METKKAKLKVVSCLLTAVLSVNVLPFCVAAQKNNETIDINSRISNAAYHHYVYAQVGKTSVTNDENSNLTYDNGWIFNEIKGKDALLSSAGATNNLFITPNSDYWVENSNSKVAVSVEYYDSDDASFSVLYSTEEIDNYNTMGTVVTEGTNTWKTKTFYVDDYTTKSSIRIVTPGWQIGSLAKGALYIGNIFVEEDKTEHPVEITPSNGVRGLIYDYGSSDSMMLNYDNLSGNDYVSVQTKYTIKNNEGTVVNAGEVNSFAINNGESIQKNINTGVAACGTYSISFDVKTIDSNGVYGLYTDSAEFSVVRTVDSGSGRHPLVGVTADLRGYQQDNLPAVKGISKIGISNFKAASYWDEVEKTEGVYTYNDLTMSCDSYLKQEGVDTIYVATQIPSFYNGGNSNLYYTDNAKAAYGKYVVDLVKKTGATQVEILNEINHNGFNHNWGHMLYNGYASYVKAAYDALQSSGHSDVDIIAGALAGADTDWIKSFKLHNVLSFDFKYFDKFSYHTYYYGGFDAADFSDKIDEIHELTGKPVIISELGWSSADDVETTASGVKMYQKASYIPEALLIAQSKGTDVVEGVYLYTLSEWGEYNKSRDYKFGIMKSPSGNGATDTYVSLAAFCNFFWDAEFNKQINKNNFETVAMDFTREGKQNIAALWTSMDSDKLAIDLGCSSINVYDMYGTPKGEVKSSDGVFSFDLSVEPIYIEGNFTKFEEAQTVISQDYSKVYASANDSFEITLTDEQARNLSVELDYNKDALTVECPEEMINGNLVLKGISGTDSGYYHIGIKLYDDSGVYYVGQTAVEIDANGHGVREETTVSGAAASYDNETRIATIAGTIQNYGPNDNVTLLVQSDSDKSIAYIRQLKLIDSNLFTQFKMPDNAKGSYTAKICGSNFATSVELAETKIVIEEHEEDDSGRVTNLTGGVSIYDKETGVVTINGTLNDWKSKDKVTFLVTEDGFTGTEASKIKFISQAKLSGNTLDYKFKMPNNSLGHFNVFVFGDKFASKTGLGFNTEDTAYITGFDIAGTSTITASAQAQNIFDKAKNVTIFIAQYDENGSLLTLKSEDKSIPANTVEMVPCSCSAEKHADATLVKAFVWDNLSGLYPLADDIDLK